MIKKLKDKKFGKTMEKNSRGKTKRKFAAVKKVRKIKKSVQKGRASKQNLQMLLNVSKKLVKKKQ